MSFDDAAGAIVPYLKRRLGLSDADARTMADTYLLAVLDQAVAGVASATVAPSTLSAARVQLVERLATRLGRLPAVRELAALLRITESQAKTLMRNVLAVSDAATDVALSSIFGRAEKGDRVGKDGAIPFGRLWHFASRSDLAFAQQLLEARGERFVTESNRDGKYVLLLGDAFTP